VGSRPGEGHNRTGSDRIKIHEYNKIDWWYNELNGRVEVGLDVL
jgi:hypothetical protein